MKRILMLAATSLALILFTSLTGNAQTDRNCTDRGSKSGTERKDPPDKNKDKDKQDRKDRDDKTYDRTRFT